MRDLIRQELKNVKVALIPDMESIGNSFVIKKGKIRSDLSQAEESLQEKKFYTIELADYILHPYDNFNLHIQWNNGIAPKDKILNVEVVKILGNMIKVSGCGTYSSNIWTGWLPISSIKIVKTLI